MASGYSGYKRRPTVEDEVYSKPTVIALADITLVLLVIVLSTGAASVQMAEVNLPDALNVASRDTNLAVTITVTKDGKSYFEDEKTPIVDKNLWTALKEIKGANMWASAIVRADKETPCEHISIVTQCLQGLGVDEICYMMTEKK